MELREYWRVIRKRILLVLFIPIVAALVSGYYSYKVTKPTYEASTTLLFNVGSVNDMPDGSTLSGLIASEVFDNAIRQAYPDLKLSNSQVNSSINVGIAGELMTISAIGPSQAFAAAVANDVATTFVKQGQSLIGMPSARVVTSADNNSSIAPISPHKKRTLEMAFGMGLLVSLGLAFMLEYLDMRVKTEADMAKFLQIRVLGSVEEYRNKVSGRQKKSAKQKTS